MRLKESRVVTNRKGLILLTLFLLFPVMIGIYEIRTAQSIIEFEKHFEDKLMIIKYSKTDWNILIQAMIFEESHNNDSAINPITHASGCLQLLKCYVIEANKLTKNRYGFTFEDRFNRQKSIQMFNIIQNHYNKKHNIYKAIKLHNPKAGFWYHKRIYKQINKIQWKQSKSMKKF